MEALRAGATLDQVSLVKPTMDDVFFELTGNGETAGAKVAA